MTKWTVTREELEALIDNAISEQHVYFGKVVVIEYQLQPHGFTIQGRAAVVDPANFVLEIGQKIAREDAINKLWQLEGYRKQIEMYDADYKEQRMKVLDELVAQAEELNMGYD